MADQWEVVGMPKGNVGAAFKTPITEQLISGPHNDFSLPEGFSSELAGLKGQKLLEQLAANLCSKTVVTDTAQQSEQETNPADGCETAAARASFVDMMMPDALLTRTENNAVTYSGSGDPLVDFFFQVVKESQKDDIHTLLDQAWECAPLETLQLVAHLRDVREGKGEKERGWDAYIWLAQKHPGTLLVNLPEIVKVGFWKDLLQLLDRLCIGEDQWEAAVKQDKKRKSLKGGNRKERRMAKHKRLKDWKATLQGSRGIFINSPGKELSQGKKEGAKHHSAVEMEVDSEDGSPDAVVARLRQERADHFVSSLCAKWAPTPKQAYDKKTLIATAIAELLYPEAHFRQPGMRTCEYTEIARRSYAKEYLKPLREAACIPETNMSQKKWSEINYERVASLCMKINKKLFIKYDKDRLKEYLRQVKKGEKRIASGALKPHELVEEAMRRAHVLYYSTYMDSDEGSSGSEGTGAEEESDAGEAIMEAQWKSYVDKLRQSGKLSSCLAVADVSGSMHGKPMNVAIALSLLTAAVAKPPFNQLICTFSATPELHVVKGDTLVKQVADVQGMHWQMNTDINAVFDLILQRAAATDLKPEDMVSSLFIFSDMEFDEATASSKMSPYQSYASLCSLPRDPTNFEKAKAEYAAAGYKLPQVVFWNLAASQIGGQKSTPVQFNEAAVALVSGFSGQLLKLFMDKPGDVEAWKVEDMSPEAVMMAAIKGKGHYDNWRLED